MKLVELSTPKIPVRPAKFSWACPGAGRVMLVIWMNLQSPALSALAMDWISAAARRRNLSLGRDLDQILSHGQTKGSAQSCENDQAENHLPQNKSPVPSYDHESKLRYPFSRGGETTAVSGTTDIAAIRLDWQCAEPSGLIPTLNDKPGMAESPHRHAEQEFDVALGFLELAQK